MADRFMHVVYCDDMRNELGNKQSWMGIYSSEYIVDRVPAVIPKIGIAITVSTPVERPFQRLSFSIKKNGEPLLDFLAPKEALVVHQRESTHMDGVTQMSLTFAVMISPLVVDSEATLQAFAETEVADELLKGPRLRIHGRERDKSGTERPQVRLERPS